MIIMGIDSSTTATGWAVIDTRLKGELRLVNSGVIKSKEKNVIVRIDYMLKTIKELYIDFKPELVVIEDLNVSRNINSTKALAGLLVGIELYLYNKNALYVTMRPSEWRKKVGIKGRLREELKKASVEYVKKYYKESVSDDEGDAVCIAEAGSSVEVENA